LGKQADGLEGFFTNFDLSVGLARFVNMPDSEGMV